VQQEEAHHGVIGPAVRCGGISDLRHPARGAGRTPACPRSPRIGR
jgi:hypothetical protein